MAGYPSISDCRTFSHAATSGCPNVYVERGRDLAERPARRDRRRRRARQDLELRRPHADRDRRPCCTDFTGDGLAFSPDGTRLAYTVALTGTRAARTPSAAGPPGTTLPGRRQQRHVLRGVAFTPDGQRLVSVNAIGFAGGDVFVHNVGGSALPALHGARRATSPTSLAVSPRAASRRQRRRRGRLLLRHRDGAHAGHHRVHAVPTDVPASTSSHDDLHRRVLARRIAARRRARTTARCGSSPTRSRRRRRRSAARSRSRAATPSTTSRSRRTACTWRSAARSPTTQLSIYNVATARGARPRDAGGRRQLAGVLTQRRRDHRRPGRCAATSSSATDATSSAELENARDQPSIQRGSILEAGYKRSQQ